MRAIFSLYVPLGSTFIIISKTFLIYIFFECYKYLPHMTFSSILCSHLIYLWIVRHLISQFPLQKKTFYSHSFISSSSFLLRERVNRAFCLPLKYFKVIIFIVSRPLTFPNLIYLIISRNLKPSFACLVIANILSTHIILIQGKTLGKKSSHLDISITIITQIRMAWKRENIFGCLCRTTTTTTAAISR